MRREIAANFKQEFRYNPASDQPQASEEVPAANDEIVKLDPYTVNATTDKISQSIHADLLKIKTEQFNWEKGGTILKAGPVQIRWGYDPETGQLELFKLRF